MTNNATQPNLQTVIRLQNISSMGLPEYSPLYSKEFKIYYRNALDYLKGYDWVSSVGDEYVGYIEPGIIGVFLFRVFSENPDVDPWIWVIVGDLPSAYIPCYNIPDPWSAVDAYIYEMDRWADAVLSSSSLDGLFPVAAEPSEELARMLKTRTAFIVDRILPDIPNAEVLDKT